MDKFELDDYISDEKLIEIYKKNKSAWVLAELQKRGVDFDNIPNSRTGE